MLITSSAFATTTDISSPASGSTVTSKPTTFTGNTVTNGPIELQEDGVTIATTTADVNGDWSITTSNLKSGTHDYTALSVQPDFNIAFMNGQAEPKIETVDVNNHQFLDPINLPNGSSSNDLVVRNSTLYVPIAENEQNAQSVECSILEYELPQMILTRQIFTRGLCSAGSIDVNPDESMAVVSYMDYNFTSFHIVAVDLDTNTVIDDFDTEFTQSNGIVFGQDGQSFFIRVGGGIAKYHVANGSIEFDGSQGYNQDFSSAIAVSPTTGQVAIADSADGNIRLINPNDLSDTTVINISNVEAVFNRLAFSHDGSNLMVVGQNVDGNHVWEINTSTELVANEYAISDYPESVGYTPDDSQYVIGDNFGSGTIFFGVPGGSNYTDSIVQPFRSYAMRNTNFIASFSNSDTSEPVTLTNSFVTASYGADPNAGITTKTVAPGKKVDVSGSGYLPNSDVTITLNSTPVLLATAKTDSSGAFSTKVTIPKNTALGAHSLVLAGRDVNGNEVSSVLSLNVAWLPATGNSATSQSIFSLFLILGGFVLVNTSRKHRFLNINN